MYYGTQTRMLVIKHNNMDILWYIKDAHVIVGVYANAHTRRTSTFMIVGSTLSISL